MNTPTKPRMPFAKWFPPTAAFLALMAATIWFTPLGWPPAARGLFAGGLMFVGSYLCSLWMQRRAGDTFRQSGSPLSQALFSGATFAVVGIVLGAG